MNIPNNIILGKKAIPMTADGEIIFPGMSVYVIEPFCIEKVRKATIYCVLRDSDSSKKYPDYYCVLEEERYCNGEGYWDDGNTEYVSRVYVDYNKAMERIKLIESDHEYLMNML